MPVIYSVWSDLLGPNNVAYTKYIFKELMPTAAIHGASHGDDYLKEVHVYIPTSALGTDVWMLPIT